MIIAGLALAAVTFLPTDPSIAREIAGSYRINAQHIIDIGPMDEVGGDLTFLDHSTLRAGRLRAINHDIFIAGPTLGSDEPESIRAEVKRDSQGKVIALRWSGEGARKQIATKIAPRVDHDVTVQNGDVTLKGVLHLPAGRGPHPAVVFAHGSGDAKRNAGVWNMFFVRQGYAVLSMDKRGVGESTGDWKMSSMDDLADDLLAGITMLRTRPEIDCGRIGIHGTSQGGWTAPLAAAKSKDVAFIIVRAGSGTSVRDTMLHEIEWSLREESYSPEEAVRGRLAAAAAFDATARGAKAFTAVVDRYRSEKWFSSVWPLNMSEEGWGRVWVQKNLHYDPATSLRKLDIPVLWVVGDLDHNVPTELSVARIREATTGNRRRVTILRLPNAGHSFLETSTGNNSEFMQSKRFAKGYWSAMETFLKAQR